MIFGKWTKLSLAALCFISFLAVLGILGPFLYNDLVWRYSEIYFGVDLPVVLLHLLEGFALFFFWAFGAAAGLLFAVDFARSSQDGKPPSFSKRSLLWGAALFFSLSFLALLYVFDNFYVSIYECVGCDLVSSAPGIFFYLFFTMLGLVVGKIMLNAAFELKLSRHATSSLLKEKNFLAIIAALTLIFIILVVTPFFIERKTRELPPEFQTTCPDGSLVDTSSSCAELVVSPAPVLNAILENCTFNKRYGEYRLDFLIKNVGTTATRVLGQIVFNSRSAYDQSESDQYAALEKAFEPGEFLRPMSSESFNENATVFSTYVGLQEQLFYLFYVEARGEIDSRDLNLRGTLITRIDLRKACANYGQED